MIIQKRWLIEPDDAYFNNFCRLPKNFRQLSSVCYGQNSELPSAYVTLSAGLWKRLS
jgi:hypothetical protein